MTSPKDAAEAAVGKKALKPIDQRMVVVATVKKAL